MRISKLSLAIVFPMIMGSGTAVAQEYPWESAYFCTAMDDTFAHTYYARPERERMIN
jgi:hypothetical protein